MNYFPNNNEEIELIKFIAKYQYLNVSDEKYFFSSKRYYKNRINNLISKKFLKKIKLNLVLDEVGIKYVKSIGFKYNKLNRNVKYLPRLLFISHLAAFYNNCHNVNFTPSFLIKDKKVFTITARRFIGILNINNFEYLVYHITKEHDKKYILSIIYDIQKENNYKNIIILVNDINRLNINDFVFGMNKVLIIKDTQINREKLKYIHNVNWPQIVHKYFRNKVVISEYNFCDYTDYRNLFISCFDFIDTEKINRIKHFVRENKNKNATIICNPELELDLKQNLPSARYLTLNLEEYINKEIKYYD